MIRSSTPAVPGPSRPCDGLVLPSALEAASATAIVPIMWPNTDPAHLLSTLRFDSSSRAATTAPPVACILYQSPRPLQEQSREGKNVIARPIGNKISPA